MPCHRSSNELASVSRAVIEPLEARQLCSSSLPLSPVQPASSNVAATAVGVKGRATQPALVNLVGRYQGQLLVTRSSGPAVVDGLGISTIAPGSTRSVLLVINRQFANGRVFGTLSVPGLGLAGALGPFNVAGKITGRRVLLNMADNGTGTGRIDAQVSPNGRIIAGKFTSILFGETTTGQLRLTLRPLTGVETLLGFRELPVNARLLSTTSNGLVISLVFA